VETAELTPARPAPVPADAAPLRLLLISDVCFVSEALASALGRDPTVLSLRITDPIEAVTLGLAAQVDAVLVHTALHEGITVVRQLREVSPTVPIIACALRETNDDVIAWAEAGVTGYIANTIRLDQFVGIIREILTGQQVCSGRVAAGLLRRIAAAANPDNGGGAMPPARWLTRRERQIAELIAASLGDKEIARHLNISVATAKSHVHNLLGKLNVRQRGHVVYALRGQPVAAPSGEKRGRTRSAAINS
jgi:two-component system, NarL family, nitrate/nitrite response regulator NarL